jgi:hypothetical protein
MSLERELRAVLAERAELSRPPLPDIAALTAGGLRRRRRRQGAIVALTTTAVLVTVAAGLAVSRGMWDTRGAEGPVDRPTPGLVDQTVVAWCVPDPDDPDGEQWIVGAGPPVKTWCTDVSVRPRPQPTDPRQDLYHQAGSTILARDTRSDSAGRGPGVYRVADGRLTQLGTVPAGVVRMSHDGRYAAWGGGGCNFRLLTVYEVATGAEVATTWGVEPPATCTGLAGIDDLGRVYLQVHEQIGSTTIPRGVLVYDMWTDEWAEVVGFPAGSYPSITYITAEGFAVSTEDPTVDAPASASVEGVVDSEGRFGQQREVPVGAGDWSLDRSMVVEARPEGVVARPADDLNTRVVLDLPDASPPPGWRFQWESSSSVLATGDESTFRCDARSGACQHLNRTGVPAHNNNSGGAR